MSRKVSDCRRFPSENDCTLTIAGEEDEVLAAATAHAVTVHHHANDEELHNWLLANLEDEVSTS